MLSDQTVRILIAGSILVHGLAHAIASFHLLGQGLGGESERRITVRTWLLSSLTPRTAALLAAPLWLGATAAFIGSSLSFWGILSTALWREFAIGGALLSLSGVVLFSGLWPGSPTPRRSSLNTMIAIALDAAILASLLLLHWPPETMFGR